MAFQVARDFQFASARIKAPEDTLAYQEVQVKGHYVAPAFQPGLQCPQTRPILLSIGRLYRRFEIATIGDLGQHDHDRV